MIEFPTLSKPTADAQQGHFATRRGDPVAPQCKLPQAACKKRMVGLTTRSERQTTLTQGSNWWGNSTRYSFSVRQIFPFRYGRLPKGVAAEQADPEVFARIVGT